MSRDYLAALLPPFSLLDEPKLSFSSEDSAATHVNPLRGLVAHGAYDSRSFQSYVPVLRVATVGPASGLKSVSALMNRLKAEHRPTDRAEYVPIYPGFEKLFGVPLAASPEQAAHIRWPEAISALGSGESVKERVVGAMHRAFDQLSMLKEHFDVVTVHLPDAWLPRLRTTEFDAHDALKAIGAKYLIPTQVINDRAFDFQHSASLCWRLAIALYVKAGGIPWKLAPMPGVPHDTAYIGLAYALRGNPQEAHYVTCCSQVFDMDGGGMQFVAFEARDPITNLEEARHNPFLSRSDMRAVLIRSLKLYQDRNGGLLPKRLVIHKTIPFKPGELEGVHDALSAIKEVECIEVGSRALWRGVWMVPSGLESPPSVPDGYPIPRGVLQMRSGVSALLWVAGNAPSASSRRDYYQGKKSIPRPLTLTRHMGSGPFEVIGKEALALTKMDWNNDALYDPVPVTIRYSQKLARTIANVPELPGKSYPYRLFM